MNLQEGLRVLSPKAPRLAEAAALILRSDPRLTACMVWRHRGGALQLAVDVGEHHEEALAGSELAVPIVSPEGDAVGALHVQSGQLEAFTPADEAWLTGLAAILTPWLDPPVQIKRVYDPAEPADGLRILCTTRWPRGVRKDAVDAWKPELGTPAELIAPRLAGQIGDEEFRAGVMASLAAPRGEAALRELAGLRARGTVITLLTSVKDRAETHLVYVREKLVALEPSEDR